MREGLAYGYGCQLIPSEDISEVCTGMKKLKRSEYTSQYENILWRPLVADDNKENVIAAFDVTNSAYKNDTVVIAAIDDQIIRSTININGELSSNDVYDLYGDNIDNPFNHMNWYLVPIDEGGNQIFSLGKEFDTSVIATTEIEYWFDNSDLTSGGAPISRHSFEGFIECARALGWKDFTIKYNEVDSEPVYYSYVNNGMITATTFKGGAVQIIHAAELPNVVDLETICLRQAYGDEELAQVYYKEFLREDIYPYYYVVLPQFDSRDLTGNDFYLWSTGDHHRGYYVIPLDSDGNEIMKPMGS